MLLINDHYQNSLKIHQENSKEMFSAKTAYAANKTAFDTPV